MKLSSSRFRAGELGLAKLRGTESGALCVALGEVGVGQIGAQELRAFAAGPVKRRFFQLAPGEV